MTAKIIRLEAFMSAIPAARPESAGGREAAPGTTDGSRGARGRRDDEGVEEVEEVVGLEGVLKIK